MSTPTRLKLKEDLYPMTGFVFTDPDGVQHVAKDLRGLVKSLSAYRVRVGRTLGDPEQDILRQLCERQPKLCRNYTPTHEPKALVRAVVADVVAMFNDENSNSERASVEVANARAAICMNCRDRVPWGADCPPCQKQAFPMIEKMLEGTPKHAGLKGQACLQALDDLQIAVWKTEGQPVLNPPKDSNCWRKME